MKRKIIEFNNEQLYLNIDKYKNGRIKIYTELTNGEPYGNITIDLPDEMQFYYDEFFINNECKCLGLEKQLVKDGIIKEISGEVRHGYGKYDIVRIDLKKLKEYDLYGYEKNIDEHKIKLCNSLRKYYEEEEEMEAE